MNLKEKIMTDKERFDKMEEDTIDFMVNTPIKESKREKFKYFYDAWWFLHDHEMFVDKSMDDKKHLEGDVCPWCGGTNKPLHRKELLNVICNHEFHNGRYLWFSRFSDCLDIDVQKVDPAKKAVDSKDRSKNTETEIWLECGPWEFVDYGEGGQWSPTHDWRLDCGGITFENAIIKLANLVYKYYGDKPAGYL